MTPRTSVWTRRTRHVLSILLGVASAGVFLACRGGDERKEQEIRLSRSDYTDRLRGFWLGSSIGNWTGLATENARVEPPFFTDADWRTPQSHEDEPIDFVLSTETWESDDDTDIEYVYQHAMEQYGTHLLTAEQISTEWREHIGLPRLWVSNLVALGQMQNGALPPDTSLPENNPMWDMIDAQLTTEIFGALAPGRPDVALEMAHLPIRTTAYLHSEWAAEFYVIMHSLVPLADPSLSRREQVSWLAEQARRRVPEWSYIADMYDFVKADYEANPDKGDWERTRDRVHARYQARSTAGYTHRSSVSSGINFAASMVSLLYGEGDFRKTIRIATLAGWDSDNPASTWGGMLGLLYGHEGLVDYFGKTDFADDYRIEATRYDLPYPTDNFTDMARRALKIVDGVVLDAMGGSIADGVWVIPNAGATIERAPVPETIVPWEIVEDSDPRWSYTNFTTEYGDAAASDATLTYADLGVRGTAEITFTGTKVQYYAARDPDGGSVTITLDGRPRGTFDLSTDVSPRGQYLVKIYESPDLPAGDHTLRIECGADDKWKTIDLLSVRVDRAHPGPRRVPADASRQVE